VQTRSWVFSEGYETCAADVELSSDPLLLAVADGCGGEGRENIIGQEILRYLSDAVFSTGSSISSEMFPGIIEEANRRKNEELGRGPDRRVLSAAFIAAFVEDGRVMIVYAGDPRFYRYRDAHLKEIVMDTSLVFQLIDSGQITAEEAQRSLSSQYNSRVGGLTQGVSFGVHGFTLQHQDWLLVMTDGVWRFVSDALIEETIREAESPLTAATRLKSRALENGGQDNLSIIVAQVFNPLRPRIA
jgi:PPM family protein phosphatase